MWPCKDFSSFIRINCSYFVHINTSILLINVHCPLSIFVIVDEEPGEEFEHVALPDGKIGAKKMKKLQEKEEKKRMREVRISIRECLVNGCSMSSFIMPPLLKLIIYYTLILFYVLIRIPKCMIYLHWSFPNVFVMFFFFANNKLIITFNASKFSDKT